MVTTHPNPKKSFTANNFYVFFQQPTSSLIFFLMLIKFRRAENFNQQSRVAF